MTSIRSEIERVRRLLSGNEFFNQSSVLLVSSVLANLVSLVGYALLTRLFPMNAVGEYFSIFAAATIISVLIHLGLLQALPLMDEVEVKTGATLLCGLSFLLIVVGCIAGFFYLSLLLICLAAGVLSLAAIVEMALIREGLTGRIALFRMLMPLAGFATVFSVAAVLPRNSTALVICYFFGIGIVVLFFYRTTVHGLVAKISATSVKTVLREYRRFPLFIGPGLLLHTAAYNLPSVAGLHFFGGVAIAAYNLAYKFVLAPATILGRAVGQVYIGKLSHKYRSKLSLAAGYKLDIVLASVALLVAIAILTIFPPVARFLFPDAGVEITKYAVALVPMTFAMVAVAPLSNLLQFTQNQRTIFIMHLTSFAGSVISFGVAIYADDFLLGVTAFSWFIFLRYIWLYLTILSVRKGL